MKIWNRTPPQPHLSLFKNSKAVEIPIKGHINPSKSHKKLEERVFQVITFGKNLMRSNPLSRNKNDARMR